MWNSSFNSIRMIRQLFRHLASFRRNRLGRQRRNQLLATMLLLLNSTKFNRERNIL